MCVSLYRTTTKDTTKLINFVAFLSLSLSLLFSPKFRRVLTLKSVTMTPTPNFSPAHVGCRPVLEVHSLCTCLRASHELIQLFIFPFVCFFCVLVDFLGASLSQATALHLLSAGYAFGRRVELVSRESQCSMGLHRRGAKRHYAPSFQIQRKKQEAHQALSILVSLGVCPHSRAGCFGTACWASLFMVLFRSSPVSSV
jgi:hypothetical protein